MTPRKTHYTSVEDLYNELDHESLFDDEETSLLEDDDLALLQAPKPVPVKKVMKKAVAKKAKPKAKPKKKR